MKTRSCIVSLLVALVLPAKAIDLSSVPTTEEEWDTMLNAIELVESNCNTNAVITDVNGRKSVGCLQIQQPYLTDSRLSYTLDHMKDRAIAYEVAKAYLRRYGASYTRRTGKPATVEVLIRIHNGGPRGAERPVTLPYLEKVKARLA